MSENQHVRCGVLGGDEGTRCQLGLHCLFVFSKKTNILSKILVDLPPDEMYIILGGQSSRVKSPKTLNTFVRIPTLSRLTVVSLTVKQKSSGSLSVHPKKDQTPIILISTILVKEPSETHPYTK